MGQAQIVNKNTFLNKIQHSLKEELATHMTQSQKRVEYYAKQGLACHFLDYIVEPLGCNPFYAMAVEMALTHIVITEKQETFYSKFIEGIKVAIIGPLLAYALLEVVPVYYPILIAAIIHSMIRSLVTQILFLSPDKTLLSLKPFLPGIMVAGAIRGFIMYNVSSRLRNLNLSETDIIFYSLITVNIFEPQIKKCMEIDILQLKPHFNETNYK